MKIVSGFSPEQFAHAFGNTTVENMADDLGVTPDELAGMIKDISEDSFKMFVAYGESKKSSVVQNDETPNSNTGGDAYDPTAVTGDGDQQPVVAAENKADQTPPPRAKVKSDRAQKVYLDPKNPMQYEDYMKVGADVINSLSDEDLSAALEQMHNMDINEFAYRYGGVKTGEEFAKKLGISTDDLETLVKTMDKDGLAYFVGYKQQAGVVPPSATQTARVGNVPIQNQTPDDVAEYISGRTDLQGLGEYERRNILQGELDALNEKVEKGDNSYETLAKVDQLKRCIAYSTIWLSKMNERDGATYFERVDEQTGRKVVDRVKEGTLRDIEGTYGVKFIPDPADPKRYKLAPDWDNRLN